MQEQKRKIPKHLGIILDGNGRWAQKRGLKRSEGHEVGADRTIEIAKVCQRLGVKYLSIYVFSTENWKRPESEVSRIMELLNLFIKNNLEELMERNVKINIMGDVSGLPYINRKVVNYRVNKTKNNDSLVLNIGLNYGGRQELVHAFENILKEIKNGNVKEIDEDLIYRNLYTGDFPELDLLIRTGGEQRISNFMIYQIAYTELYFTDVLWPDFNEEELIKAFDDFTSRDRRFGGINE